MGTEIRQFTSIKEIVDFTTNQILQNKSLFEDYSQWLGTLLRDFEKDHKDDEWYKKTAAIQKTLKSQSKQPPAKSPKIRKQKEKVEKEKLNHAGFTQAIFKYHSPMKRKPKCSLKQLRKSKLKFKSSRNLDSQFSSFLV